MTHYEIILTILFTDNKFHFRYEKIIDALSSSTISKVILFQSKHAGTVNNVLGCSTDDTLVRNYPIYEKIFYTHLNDKLLSEIYRLRKKFISCI